MLSFLYSLRYGYPQKTFGGPGKASTYLPSLVPNTVAHDLEHYCNFLHLGVRVCLNSLETIFPREKEQKRTKNLEETAIRYSVIIRVT